MSTSPLAERIAASFTAWELRGRGWILADYPVSLEPPYRPFFLLPAPENRQGQIDDGRRPTFWSRLAEHFSASQNDETALAQEQQTFEEEPPFPVFERDGLVFHHILLPTDFSTSPDVTAQLLGAVTAGFHPVSFEMVGCAGTVAIQIASSTLDADHVASCIAGYAPAAAVIPGDDLLAGISQIGFASFVVDFGYASEFFLPLPSRKSFPADPYVPLIAACARTGEDETLCFQVLFEKVRNPWHKAIREAVSAPDGSAIFSDEPDFATAARDKTSAPLYAAVVRVAARADSRERTMELVRSTKAFISQFSRPVGNSLIPLNNDGYDDDDHRYALIRRESLRTGMIVSQDELAALVHFPDATVRQPSLVRDVRRTKALPSIAKGNPCIIGENVHRGVAEEASLGVTERLAHTMIVGASGTGKSTLLVHMIRQDMECGDGCAVLDPHGDLIEEIITRVPKARLGDVILFDPSDAEWPVGFNILSAKTDIEKSILASDIVAIFQRLSTSWGDTMSAVLANAALAILESRDGGTLLHLRRFLVDDGFRRAVLDTVANDEVLFFWRTEWPHIGARSIGPILTRLNTFLRSKLIRHIVGQRKPALRLDTVVERKQVFLAKLSQGLIGNENAYLLGSLLLSNFLQVALARQKLVRDERNPFWLYLDEAEHFVTPSVASLLTEARKYGVGLHPAFQMLSQLRGLPAVESAVLANAHTRIVFRAGDDDAGKLADGFSFFEANDLRNLARGEAIVRIGEATNDFNVRTFPTQPVGEAEVRSRREAVVVGSRRNYAVPLANVAKELEEVRAAAAIGRELTEQPERSASTAEPAEPTSAAPPDTRVEKRVVPKQQKPLLEEPAPLGRGGQEHKYLQHLIKRLAEERGFRAVIEEQVHGGQVDVALRRGDTTVACEVSITTGQEHELENVRKCLATGFTHIWLVVTDKKRRDKLARVVEGVDTRGAVRVMASEDLVAAFDTLLPLPATSEKIVGGYKVKATRRVVSYEDYEKRQAAIAEVLARSLAKRKKGDL